MTDVFISYATADRERARPIADAIASHGWSVWWDRKIKAGQSFDEVIEREIETAKYIVVLWSAASISSEWVKNEAAVAVQRSVLIPVRIDNVKLPLEFRRKQTADLIAWNGDPSHPGLLALFEALGNATPQSAPPPAAAISLKRPAGQLRRLWFAAGVAGLSLGSFLTYLVVAGSAGIGAAKPTGYPAVFDADRLPLPAKGRAPLFGSTAKNSSPTLPVNLETSDKGVFLDVISFAQAGELVTVEWVVRNTSGQKTLFCSHASQASLIDQTSGESWRALHSGGPAARCQSLPPGTHSGAWAKFKLSALEERRFALSLRTLPKAPELPMPQVSEK